MAQPVTGAEIVNRQVPQGDIDPSVKIPKQAREAGKRAEIVQRAFTGQAEPSVTDQIPPQEPAPQPQEPAPQPQEPTPQPQEPTPQPQPTDWEHRYNSLQGRYNQQRDAIAQLSAQVQRLQAEAEALRAQAPPPADPNNPPSSLLTQDEIESYGADFVDVMRRVVKEATDPLHAEIGNLRGQLGSVQAETGQQLVNRMNIELNAAVPNWQELNRDQKFIAWSQLPDVFSGAIRRQLMQDAWNNGDARRLTAFFQAYLAEEAATDPQAGAHRQPVMATVVSSAPVPAHTFQGTGPASAPTSPLHPGQPQVSLTDLAAPGRAHSAAGMPAEKPVYSPHDITRFYTDVSAGRWRGREAQQQAVEADIIAAQHEGRILNGSGNYQPNPPRGFTR